MRHLNGLQTSAQVLAAGERGKGKREKAGSRQKLELDCPYGLVLSALLLIWPALCASNVSQQGDALPDITWSEWQWHLVYYTMIPGDCGVRDISLREIPSLPPLPWPISQGLHGSPSLRLPHGVPA